MGWGRTDDTLHAHRKTRAVRKSHETKRRDVAPFGLWVLAQSWCSGSNTGGFIPAEVLDDWDDDAPALAARLVEAGLWDRAEQDGEPGYRFHDWEDYSAPSESGLVGNHIRWHVKKGVISPGCAFCERIVDAPEDSDDIGAISGRVAPESHGDIAPESPTRTRPDPTRTRPVPDNNTAHPKGERGAGFPEFWKLYPRKIGKGQAERAWAGAVKKTSPAEIIAGLRRQLPSLAMQRRTDGDYRPYPATWLNGQRWADEQDSSGPRTAWDRAQEVRA